MMAPPEKIAQAQGIQGAAFSLGTMLPFVTLPYLGNEAWRFSYLIPATLSLDVYKRQSVYNTVVCRLSAEIDVFNRR